MSVPRAGSRSQRFFTFLSPSLPRASSVEMGIRGDFEKGNSYTLKLLGLLTIRCFYVVQKQKGVADAMIKAASTVVSGVT
jgi:hypothetical protein